MYSYLIVKHLQKSRESIADWDSSFCLVVEKNNFFIFHTKEVARWVDTKRKHGET